MWVFIASAFLGGSMFKDILIGILTGVWIFKNPALNFAYVIVCAGLTANAVIAAAVMEEP